MDEDSQVQRVALKGFEGKVPAIIKSQFGKSIIEGY